MVLAAMRSGAGLGARSASGTAPDAPGSRPARTADSANGVSSGDGPGLTSTLRSRAVDAADEAEAWDAFVAAHPVGHFLQTSGWARFRASQGWLATRIELVDVESRIVAGAVVLERHARGGSLSYVPRGPVCSPVSAAWPELLSAMRERACRSSVALRVEANWPDTDAARAALRDHGLREADPIQPPSTVRVDLSKGEDELLADMKQKWRYNVRLASRRGVTVVRGQPADVDTFEDLMDVTAQRDRFAARPRGYYADAYRAIPGARLYLARFEGRSLGAIFVVHHGDTATYLYGASSSEERHRMPNHLLQWEAMRQARQAGCRWYDFWGIPDEVGRSVVAGGEPGDVTEGRGGLWGVWGFKRGFGGRVERTVGAWDDVYAPVRYWAGTTLVPWLRARLPTGGASSMIG